MSEKEFFGGLNILDEEEVRLQRCFLRRVVLWIIAGAFIAGFVVYGINKAFADSFSSPRGDEKVERHQSKCDDADILAHILRMGGAPFIDQFKKATLTYGGRTWRSCWIEIEEVVYSVDEEGAPFQPIPARMFKDGGA